MTLKHTLKEELAEILDYLRGSEPYKTSYEEDVTPNVESIIEAFNKILPEKINNIVLPPPIQGIPTDYTNGHEAGRVQAHNQYHDQIERAINES
jgi:hypothetical protein